MKLATVRLAATTLWRSPRRTLLTALAIGNAVAGGLMFYGFTRNTFWGLSESFARGGNGHVQIAKPDWFDTAAPELARTDRARMLAARAAIEADPVIATHLYTSTLRRQVMGMVSAGSRSAVFLGVGTEPAAEPRIAPLAQPAAGEALSADVADGVLLGGALADRLGVHPGDVVTALVTTDPGRTNAMDLTVRGIARTGSQELDATMLTMPVDTALSLVEGTTADVLVLAVEDTADTDLVLARARDVLRDFPELSARPWYERASYYRAVRALYDRIFGVFEGLMALVTVLSLSHAVAAVVAERKAEIAMLRVVGLRRAEVAALFVVEGAMLGGVGCVIGTVGAHLVAAIVRQVGGIPMPPPPGFTVGYAAQFQMDLLGYLIVLPTTLLAAAVASAIPALRASRGELSRGLAGLIVLIALLPGIAHADTSLLAKADAARGLPADQRCVLDLAILDAAGTQGWRVALHGADALAVQATATEGKRQAVLQIGADTWFQTEAMRAAMKVGPSQRVAGQLSLGDLLSARLSDTWTVTATTPTASGTTVRATSAAWAAGEFDFDSASVLRTVRFYGSSGKLVRTATWRWSGARLLGLDVVDAARPDQRTTLDLTVPRCARADLGATAETLLTAARALLQEPG